MPALAPQEIRTFFITTVTWGRRSVFQAERNVQLMMEILSDNRAKKRFELHEFVIMSDHLHFLITPAPDQSIEKCVQFIKGGFSFRIKKELGKNMEIWQPSFTEHRIKDVEDYRKHASYIHENPVRAGLVAMAHGFPYSSATRRDEIDPMPLHFRG